MKKIVKIKESDIYRIVKLILESDETKLSSVDKFFNELGSIKGDLSQESDGKYTYKKEVESIQTALQILGYQLPKYGIDGLFGPETKEQIIKFQQDNKLTPNGMVDQNLVNTLISKLKAKGVSESDVKQYITNFSMIGGSQDDDFYKAILNSLGAPITDDNMKFLYAWRQVEGGGAKNNPFNTVFNLTKDPQISNYNKVGVKNYSTPEYGLEATVRTLKQPMYSDIVSGLVGDIGLDKLVSLNGLKKWSGGDPSYLSLFGKVANDYATGTQVKPQPIGVSKGGETMTESTGKKDACYRKVRSRYKVWPSAYASGALVRCRKVGAANWGNKTNEEIDESKKTDFSEEIKQGLQDWISKRGDSKNVSDEQLDEKWSDKYKRSIDCNHPKGFSQRAHCQGRKKHHESIEETTKKTDFSKEKKSGLHGWFSRRGGEGSKGWVDCNTCRKDPETGKKKCKPCGRQEGEDRKYPACRPTPSACGTPKKGSHWGKKSNGK